MSRATQTEAELAVFSLCRNVSTKIRAILGSPLRVAGLVVVLLSCVYLAFLLLPFDPAVLFLVLIEGLAISGCVITVAPLFGGTVKAEAFTDYEKFQWFQVREVRFYWKSDSLQQKDFLPAKTRRRLVRCIGLFWLTALIVVIFGSIVEV